MILTGVEWHGHAIAGAAGASFDPLKNTVIARVEDDQLYGGVVYYDYTGKSVGMHTAGFRPGWISRDLLWMCFHYPFEQLGVTKVLGEVISSNAKALALDKHLGFKVEAVISDVFPDGDAVIMGMYKADCRWLAIKPTLVREGNSDDGQKGQRSTGGT